jgi:hypothetical protein
MVVWQISILNLPDVYFNNEKLVWDNNLTMSSFYLLCLHASKSKIDLWPEYVYIANSINSDNDPLDISPTMLTLQMLLYSPAHGEQMAWAMRLAV